MEEKENNIFGENVFQEVNVERPPGNGNNCHGHQTSIQAGGHGHWVGDSCGCDGNVISAPIDGWIYGLIVIALILIFRLKNGKHIGK